MNQESIKMPQDLPSQKKRTVERHYKHYFPYCIPFYWININVVTSQLE